MILAIDLICMEVAVDRENGPRIESFRQRNQRRVGKVHRRIGILAHQYSHARTLLRRPIMHNDQLVVKELPKLKAPPVLEFRSPDGGDTLPP